MAGGAGIAPALAGKARSYNALRNYAPHTHTLSHPHKPYSSKVIPSGHGLCPER